MVIALMNGSIARELRLRGSRLDRHEHAERIVFRHGLAHERLRRLVAQPPTMTICATFAW